MYILDSNTIIYLSKELISVDEIFSDEEEYMISVITYMEVLGYSFESEEEKQIIKQLLFYLEIIYINKKIANKVIEIRKENIIKLPDAIICASSIINKATLITNDIKLKNIKNLKLRLLNL